MTIPVTTIRTIGSRRELFVDTYLIDRLTDLRLTLHPPQEANIALQFDQPWEGRYCGYSSIFEADGVVHLYYRGWPEEVKNGEFTCYARSTDGITFERVALDLHPMPDHPQTNILLAGGEGTHSFAPLIDPRPGVPAEERYKALGLVKFEGMGSTLVAMTSADGLRWRRLREEPVITAGAFDSHNIVFWSTHEECFVAYVRTWANATPENPKLHSGVRTFSRTVSDDFIHWSAPVPVRFGETPPEELYTNSMLPYSRAPHLLVGFPKRFNPGRQTMSDEEAATYDVLQKYVGDVSDGVFVSSRDGVHIDRTFMGAYVRPGRDRANWVSRTNMSTWGIVQTAEDELSLYYIQRYTTPSIRLRRFTLRVDGFASVQAPYEGGELLTHPLQVEGDVLRLNYASSGAGGIRVELQDATGQPLPGHVLADCDEVFGDELDRAVTWGGKAAIHNPSGGPLRLRFAMRDADLYALRFGAAE